MIPESYLSYYIHKQNSKTNNKNDKFLLKKFKKNYSKNQAIFRFSQVLVTIKLHELS